MEDSERVKPWRQAVQDAGRERMAALGLTVPIAEPVALTAILTVALRPKRSKYDRPAGPPDLDKLLRAIGDALTIGGVIRDDALIVEIDAAGKYWPGQHPRAPKTPGAFIMVRTLRSPFG
jgi:crossover junction endodeoxyribonuclease RusA